MPDERIADTEVALPKVAVVLLNWNDKENTEECLKSLASIDYPNCDIIVVDNNSTDGSKEYIKKQFPNAILLENDVNLGFAGGFNTGIDKAARLGAEYVLCLNNDTVLDRKFLRELVVEGEKREDAVGFCPIEYDYYDPKNIVYAGGRFGLMRIRTFGSGETDSGRYSHTVETGTLCGAAIMVRTSALLAVGSFDTDYFFDWEDKDLAMRLTRAGFRLVFVPSAMFWHKRRSSTGNKITPLTVYFNVRNGILFAKKNRTGLGRLVFVAFFLASSIPVLLGKSSNFRKSLQVIVWAIQWHLDRNALPCDSSMVEVLRTI